MKKYRFAFLVLAFVVILFVINVWSVLSLERPTNLAWNELGDSMGVLNALFSGLAFAGFLVSLTWQRQELSLTRQSVEEQTRELSRAADAHNQQVAQFQAQQSLQMQSQFHAQFMFWHDLWLHEHNGVNADESARDQCVTLCGEVHERDGQSLGKDARDVFPGGYYNFLRYCLEELEALPVADAKRAAELRQRYARILRAGLSDMEKKILLLGQFQWAPTEGSLAYLIGKYEILHGCGDWARDHCKKIWLNYRGVFNGASHEDE
ncbi:hypothetical protein [Celeribacter ethanolicus]|uniref:hypothetical protein n=1 Tax=Celeribacter ethanolicus TaxID=1758178 RepID=UPI000836DEB1|nr:hypothetical protein [Celeribacter ethanolicus]